MVGLAVATCAGGLSACGTQADATQAKAAAERLYQSAQHRDGTTACGQLSPDTRAQLVKDHNGERCAKAVLGVSLRGARAARVRVFGTSAQVVLAGGDTVFLGRTHEGWRVEAFGCRPQGGGPYDCEEQA
jgi:hypothetical protein